MTSDNPIIGMESVIDIINEWSITRPEFKKLTKKQKEKMIMRRLERRNAEIVPRREYYDLWEFRVRGW